MPKETAIDYNCIVNRFDNFAHIIDVNTLTVVKNIDLQINCLGKGDKVLLGLENAVVDLSLNTILRISNNILSLYSFKAYIFIGFSNNVEIYLDKILFKSIDIEKASVSYFFSERFFLAVQAYEDFVSIYKIVYDNEYLSDFEENEEPLYENPENDEKASEDLDDIIESQGITELLITPSSEVNVIMTFEPTSKLLNNVFTKQKKSIKKLKIPDKPVTFHKKIKSSGYGVASKPLKKGKNLLAKQKNYPLDSACPSILQEDQKFPKDSPLHSGPIFNISYNKDGTKLASSGGDGAAYIVKLPVSKHKGDRIPLVGHEFSVNSIV